jgi:hypothetical protein
MQYRVFTLKTLVAAVALALPLVTSAQDANSLAVPNYTAEQAAGSYNAAFYNQIGVKYALKAGADGHGVIVADLDTGIDPTHVKGEFAGRVLPQQAVNFVYTYASPRAVPTVTLVTSTVAYNDPHGHGTITAGLLGASIDGYGSFGASPYATLLPIQVLDKNGTGSWNVISKGIDVAVAAKARVINMSIGGVAGDPSLVTSLTKAVNSNTLVVIAAGNSTGVNPLFPAIYAKEAWANGSILAVGAYGLTPTYSQVMQNVLVGKKIVKQLVNVLNPVSMWTPSMASFSNKAGSTKDFYLVAPGNNVYTTAAGGGYAYAAGTSIAAPIVAGAAADIMSLWPRLTAAQTGQILLTTADPTICGYTTVNAVCGHGMLRIDRAMQPIGATVVPTATGQAISTSKATVSVGPAAGLAPVKAMSSVNTAILDSYSRDFYVPASNLIATAPKSTLSASDLFTVTDNHSRVAALNTKNFDAVVVSKFATDADKLGLVGDVRDTGSIVGSSMTMKFNGTEFSFGNGGFTNKYFGLADTRDVAYYTRDAMSNPYLGLATSNSYIGGGFRLSPNTKFRVGFVSNGKLNPTIALTSTRLDTAKTTGALVEVDHSFGEKTNVVASIGTIREGGSFLSGVSTSAGLQNGTTQFVSFGGSYKVASNYTAVATYSFGTTTGAGGLVATDASVRTNAISMGLIGRNIVQNDDTVSVAMTMPMAVTSGTMNMNVATGVDITGKAHFTNVAASMVPDARERDFEMSYTFRPSKTSSMSLVGVTRMNAGNDASAPTDRVVGLRWSKTF